MSSIESELWNIYTYYTLHSNPKDPSKINGTVMYKFCRDIMVVDASMTEKPVTQAELHIIFTSELKQRKKTAATDKSDRIDYEGFLSCLMKIALKCYPSCGTYEDAMQQLLMDNVLPLASRRTVVDVSTLVHQPAIEALFIYYEEALRQVFQNYASFSDQSTKSKTLVKSMGQLSGKSFEMQRNEFIQAKEKEHYQSSQASLVGYAEFLKFAADFGLLSNLGLTCLDLGDIYLVVLTLNKVGTTVRKIDFKEFWEALVRCAIVAFKNHPNITTVDKVKGVFLYIWRHIQASIQEQVIRSGTVMSSQSSQKVTLLRGSQILNERFLSQWSKDGHRDYLAVPEIVVPDGSSVMKRLLSSMHHQQPVDERAEGESQHTSRLGTPLARPKSSKGSNSATITSPPPAPIPPQQQYCIDIDVEQQMTRDVHGSNVALRGQVNTDYSPFGDDRITAAKLKKLLQQRPDITKLLSDCIIESQIDDN